MHSIRLNIEDSIYERLMGLLEILPKGSIEVEEEYAYTKNCPPELIISSSAEVRRRVYEAEKEESLSEEEYEREMNKFFQEELGVKR